MFKALGRLTLMSVWYIWIASAALGAIAKYLLGFSVEEAMPYCLFIGFVIGVIYFVFTLSVAIRAARREESE